MKKLIKNIFIPLLEIQSKTIEYNENISKEDRIVKIVSKIEHSIFDKNFTYFANPNKEHPNDAGQEPQEKTGVSVTTNEHDENKNAEENESCKKEELDKIKGISDQDSLEECLVNFMIFSWNLNFFKKGFRELFWWGKRAL